MLFVIHLAFVCILPHLASAQASQSPDQQDVLKAILLIGNAWSQNNLDSLEKYIHEEYRHTDVRGEIQNRSEWLNYVKERKAKNLSNPKVEFEQTQIKVYGDYALVTGINVFSGLAYTANDTNSKGPRKLRYSQVLKKENGIWKRILFQATYLESR